MVEIRKETGFFRSRDGSDIYYEVRGKGPPIVLLYGFACSIHHWRHQIQHFAHKHKIVVMDYRGHQSSPKPKDPATLSIDTLAEDVLHLIRHLRLGRASFWGHSFGSQVILAAYKKYPEHFKNMVLINGFAANPLRRTFGNKYALLAFRAFKQGYRISPSPVTQVWKKAVTHPLTMRMTALTGGFNLQLSSFHDVEIYSKGVSIIDLEVFTELFHQMITHDERPLLPHIDVPTLIIGGSKDTITPISIQQDLARIIPKSEFLSVPFGSHCTPLDMPELVNLRIEKFLGRNR